MNFEFKKLSIPDVILIEPEVFKDERGFFMEVYKKSIFEKEGIKVNFVQDNYSKSQKNVIRGLHYQMPPAEQAKLVRCVKGKVFDVVVDIRRGSPYYGKWIGDYLSEENKGMLFIPSGFAHGFLTLSEEADIVYKTSNEYSSQHERGILWKDPNIAIEWPLEGEPILSEKDKKLPVLKEADNNFLFQD